MIGIIDYLQNVVIFLVFIVVIVLLAHLLRYVVDSHGIRSVPGPTLAKFSDVWLGLVSGHGHRSEVVHEMHKKYGLLQVKGRCCVRLTVGFYYNRHLCPVSP
jgi:benzoate 4-monooxygenase